MKFEKIPGWQRALSLHPYRSPAKTEPYRGRTAVHRRRTVRRPPPPPPTIPVVARRSPRFYVSFVCSRRCRFFFLSLCRVRIDVFVPLSSSSSSFTVRANKNRKKKSQTCFRARIDRYHRKIKTNPLPLRGFAGYFSSFQFIPGGGFFFCFSLHLPHTYKYPVCARTGRRKRYDDFPTTTEIRPSRAAHAADAVDVRIRPWR